MAKAGWSAARKIAVTCLANAALKLLLGAASSTLTNR